MWFSTCKIHDVENPRRKIRSFRRVENHVSYVTYVTDPTLSPALLLRGLLYFVFYGVFCEVPKPNLQMCGKLMSDVS